MKAIVATQYGSPDVLQLIEGDKPARGENEVRVNVHAASVDCSDLTLIRGERDQGNFGPKRPLVPDERRSADEGRRDRTVHGSTWRTLAEWAFLSEPGAERRVMEQVREVVRDVQAATRRLERLTTAVAEATMNAMEHGNHYRRDVPVLIRVCASPTALAVRITDQGGSQARPDPIVPDLEAKLAGFQSPRGWGLFLIRQLVDEVRVTGDEAARTSELIV